MKFFGPPKPERVLLRRNTLYRVQLLGLGRLGARSGDLSMVYVHYP